MSEHKRNGIGSMVHHYNISDDGDIMFLKAANFFNSSSSLTQEETLFWHTNSYDCLYILFGAVNLRYFPDALRPQKNL